jgi:hypothetical protein
VPAQRSAPPWRVRCHTPGDEDDEADELDEQLDEIDVADLAAAMRAIDEMFGR